MIVIPEGFVHFYINDSGGSENPLKFIAVFNNPEFRVIDRGELPEIDCEQGAATSGS